MSVGVGLPHTWDGGAQTRSEITTLLAVFALLASIFAGVATGVQLLQQHMDRKQAACMTHACWEVECLRGLHEIKRSDTMCSRFTYDKLHEDTMSLHRVYSRSPSNASDSSRTSSDSNISSRSTPA